MLVLVAATAYGVSHLFAPRAAYLQVGAMLGTIMVANVFFVIIPAHWELIRAKEAGREPDPAANARGKQRSVHNNYLTLPVLFAMLSNHFAFTYSHCGRVARPRVADGDRRRDPPLLQPAPRRPQRVGDPGARGGFAGGDRDLAPAARDARRRPGRAVLARERHRRRALCRLPLDAPDAAGLLRRRRAASRSTRREQINARAADIEQQAVVLKAMPLGNVTHMTQAERDALGTWIRQGANIP